MCLEGQINHPDHPDGHNKSHRPRELLPKTRWELGVRFFSPDPQFTTDPCRFWCFTPRADPSAVAQAGMEAEAQGGSINFGLAARAAPRGGGDMTCEITQPGFFCF